MTKFRQYDAIDCGPAYSHMLAGLLLSLMLPYLTQAMVDNEIGNKPIRYSQS
ncbi:MAG: hypothetical protein HDS15_03815 [Bacteroides sp.]|nr:hypothetical protein [Bacteroides sp.]